MKQVYEISKRETAVGDCYVTVRLNGREIYTTLWLGETDEQIIARAKAHYESERD